MTLDFDPVSAYDEAFAGKFTQVVDHIGRAQPLAVGQWSSAPDRIDQKLFIEPCTGATVDVGCGPGRLVAELTTRQIPAMGIDVSAEAIRQTRVRGALAVRCDVFTKVPGDGQWEFALLADGNLGIGGDPVRLLTRLRHLLAPHGRVIAEVADDGTGLVRERHRLRVEGRMSAQFDWAVVGLDAIDEIATRAGLVVAQTESVGGRHTATMVRSLP